MWAIAFALAKKQSLAWRDGFKRREHSLPCTQPFIHPLLQPIHHKNTTWSTSTSSTESRGPRKSAKFSMDGFERLHTGMLFAPQGFFIKHLTDVDNSQRMVVIGFFFFLLPIGSTRTSTLAASKLDLRPLLALSLSLVKRSPKSSALRFLYSSQAH